jgi:type I restriction enzyme M protein
MITGELKSRIDKLWEEFWTGGIANPLTVIEQISFLMFARMLDISETRNEKRSVRTKKPFKRVFNDDQQHLRWSNFKQLGADEMLPLMRDQVFPHFKTIVEMDTQEGAQRTTFQEYFKDAQLMIQKPSLGAWKRLNYAPCLSMAPSFGVAPRVTYNEYAPLGAP